MCGNMMGITVNKGKVRRDLIRVIKLITLGPGR
ncbi:MAG: hypothetical protein MAG715_00884 [Methanonatronarchaeales archaeon]|nr:hypothetical protein [Methanonatronarchaeales archaeon]